METAVSANDYQNGEAQTDADAEIASVLPANAVALGGFREKGEFKIAGVNLLRGHYGAWYVFTVVHGEIKSGFCASYRRRERWLARFGRRQLPQSRWFGQLFALRMLWLSLTRQTQC